MSNLGQYRSRIRRWPRHVFDSPWFVSINRCHGRGTEAFKAMASGLFTYPSQPLHTNLKGNTAVSIPSLADHHTLEADEIRDVGAIGQMLSRSSNDGTVIHFFPTVVEHFDNTGMSFAMYTDKTVHSFLDATDVQGEQARMLPLANNYRLPPL